MSDKVYKNLPVEKSQSINLRELLESISHPSLKIKMTLRNK